MGAVLLHRKLELGFKVLTFTGWTRKMFLKDRWQYSLNFRKYYKATLTLFKSLAFQKYIQQK